MLKNVITEEWEVFSEREREREREKERDDDLGENRTYPIKMNLKDSNPVQLNDNSVPQNACKELKMYIKYLINKKWIVHSSSSYSSSFLLVRKKDGSIRMCCDYTKINAKTIPERHSLSRIQNILDNLGGNQYFTILDQNKAHHQPHLNSGNRKVTAFIMPWGFYKWVRTHLH